jgi:hypothetical protein
MTSQADYVPGLPVVRKWLRTKHAIVFRLTVGVVQINFFDHTKIIVNEPQDTVTYIDKSGVIATFSLADIACSRHPSIEDLASRLSYAADVVGHLVNKTRASGATLQA